MLRLNVIPTRAAIVVGRCLHSVPAFPRPLPSPFLTSHYHCSPSDEFPGEWCMCHPQPTFVVSEKDVNCGVRCGAGLWPVREL